MKVFQSERRFRTSGGLHVTDITDEVKEMVAESGVVDGIVVKIRAMSVTEQGDNVIGLGQPIAASELA